jgi:ABC-2 type transport system permease protein
MRANVAVFFHELKRNKLSLVIWAGVISFMLGVCIIIYPEMSSQMGELSDMFSDMGSFSDAFGMDQINFGEFMGYFAIECGNTLGLGGAFFAALCGVLALYKEEKDRTAEFLFSHPISRRSVIMQKLASVFAQITILNAVVAGVCTLAILAIGESADAKILFLLFFSYYLLQLEIAAISFGISAFIKNGGVGIALGMAFVMYFVNIISNLSEDVEFLKYITPFSYADGSAIVSAETIEIKYLAVGAILFALGIAVAFVKYGKKDISA